MVKNVDERIARIKQQREALAQRLNALEQKSKSEARKRDTRRKIIVGGAVIAQMEKVPDFANFIRTFLDASVGRQNDREAIADLLNAASGVASAVAPEKSGVSPAPRVPSAPVTPPTQPSATQPPPRVSSPRSSPRVQTRNSRPTILSLPISTIFPASLDEKANRSAKTRNFLRSSGGSAPAPPGCIKAR